MFGLEELFCHIDDFYQAFEPRWFQTLLGQDVRHRHRSRSLQLSEIVTILVAFHRQGHRNFKVFHSNIRVINRFNPWKIPFHKHATMLLNFCFKICFLDFAEHVILYRIFERVGAHQLN